MKSFPKQQKEFVFGSFVYDYDLIKQDRKTLSLTVTPDMQISVKCPHEADDERIEQFLRKKWFWLQKQLNFFENYQRKIYKKEYVSGESFHYLGRQHKLVVRTGDENRVSLLRGVLMVLTTKSVGSGSHTKGLVNGWYSQRREQVFAERFGEMLERFDYKHTPALVTRDMKRRWGSFVNKDKIILHPKLIHVPKDCIDYVIVHELCHIRYKNHDKKFFSFLDEKCPDWKKKKEKLEAVGVHVL